MSMKQMIYEIVAACGQGLALILCVAYFLH